MKLKKIAVLALSAAMMLGMPLQVWADSTEASKPYIALGADLNAQEKQTVLELLGVSEKELGNYKVETVTNKEEHKYLDSYVSASVIGNRALSSVKVTQKKEGSGIKVKTQNISYCTVEMYQNALATAGIKNAEIQVVGPYKISGTAGLVGAIKAYEAMTGENVDNTSMDTATNELVITSDLAQELQDPEKAAQLVAFVKNEVASRNLSRDEISSLVDEAATTFEVQLSEENKQQIVDLMEKIKDLDLDVNQLQQQISGLYDKLKNLGLDINSEEVQGFLSKLIDWIKELVSKIGN